MDEYRKKRVERLLQELRYEVQRGMMEGEIDESLGFTFVVPKSKHFPNGVVECSFRTRPVPHHGMVVGAEDPKLKVVK